MRSLETLDLVVIGAFLALSLGIGLAVGRKQGGSMSDFFLSGRTLPWWMAGVSMAATNFSIDTPLAITKYVAQHGVAGVWFFWSNAISALLAAFLFARLWRRAEVVTDAELIELRYAGRPAAGLRLLKGFYFGVFLNCYVLGWVLLAVIKVLSGVTDLPVPAVLTVAVAVAFVYTLTAGLKGVVVTDLLQFGIAQVGSVVLAVYAVAEVGGLSGLSSRLAERFGPSGAVTRMVPAVGEASAGDMALMPASAFFVYLGVQWWAYKYSDGGGKHIQRMMACRTEGHAQGAAVFFSLVNYALQVWPWILAALCSLVLFPDLPDPEMGYPKLMAELLPAGVLGLLLVTMIGAFMSTVDTHLNLGAAYVVNDLYRRFLRPDADERHYVFVSRLTMLGLLLAATAIGLSLESIGDAWKLVLSFTAGAGLVWILRWFWWRVNAWSEVSAMLASGLCTGALSLWAPELPYTQRLLVIVGVSTVVWLSVTFLTPPVPDEVLLRFVRRVRSGSPGWRRLLERHGVEVEPFLGRALVDWLIGVVALFSLNFGVGQLLIGSSAAGAGLLVLAAVAGAALFTRRRPSGPDLR